MKKTAVNLLLLLLLLNPALTGANTTRDIGPEPELDTGKIGKWISFYTNLERISKNLNPLTYEPVLENAAGWQAGYCVKIKTLDHYSTVPEMRTVKERVVHFGGSYNSWGENLTVQFCSNTEGVPFYKRNDSAGEYKDYSNYTIYWRDEQQMAYAMLTAWMNSPGHRANILTAGFTMIGASAAKGVYSGEKSYYGCQVFSAKRYFIDGEKIPGSEFSKMAVTKSTADGKNLFSISYKGSFEIRVIEVIGETKPVSHPVVKNGDAWLFKAEKRPEGRLIAVLYDKNLDVMYPVKILE